MLYYALWVFFIYAFLGWCTEVSFAVLKSGKFVNRGFLNGPLCPIYGLGMLIILKTLGPWRDQKLILFFGALILTSALELLVGWLFFHLFQMRWWDYREEPFNLGGYICLYFSVIWGLACVFVLELIQPLVDELIQLLPLSLGKILLMVFSLYLLIDLWATVQTVIKTNRTLKKIDELGRKIRKVSDEIGELVASSTTKTKENLTTARVYSNQELEKHKEKLQEWKQERDLLYEKKIFGARRLLKAFPKVEHRQYNAVLMEWKKMKEIERKEKSGASKKSLDK